LSDDRADTLSRGGFTEVNVGSGDGEGGCQGNERQTGRVGSGLVNVRQRRGKIRTTTESERKRWRSVAREEPVAVVRASEDSARVLRVRHRRPESFDVRVRAVDLHTEYQGTSASFEKGWTLDEGDGLSAHKGGSGVDDGRGACDGDGLPAGLDATERDGPVGFVGDGSVWRGGSFEAE
jgi:hypothetical protein